MTPGGYAYGQSKAATTHMMKQLATGSLPYKIRSNVVAPGCTSFVSLLFSGAFVPCFEKMGFRETRCE